MKKVIKWVSVLILTILVIIIVNVMFNSADNRLEASLMHQELKQENAMIGTVDYKERDMLYFEPNQSNTGVIVLDSKDLNDLKENTDYILWFNYTDDVIDYQTLDSYVKEFSK